MHYALSLAQTAASRDEVPIAAVLYTAAGDVVAAGYNQTIGESDTTAHAEVVALRRACRLRGNYRLPDLHMAVTLEPCAMCIGAVFHARLPQLLYAAADEKSGACGSVVNLPEYRLLNHHTQVQGGLCATKSATLLRDFFNKRR